MFFYNDNCDQPTGYGTTWRKKRRRYLVWSMCLLRNRLFKSTTYHLISYLIFVVIVSVHPSVCFTTPYDKKLLSRITFGPSTSVITSCLLKLSTLYIPALCVSLLQLVSISLISRFGLISLAFGFSALPPSVTLFFQICIPWVPFGCSAWIGHVFVSIWLQVQFVSNSLMYTTCPLQGLSTAWNQHSLQNRKVWLRFLAYVIAAFEVDWLLTPLQLHIYQASSYICFITWYWTPLLKQVQEDSSSAYGTAGKLNMNSLTERTLSPPGPGGLFLGNKTMASAYADGPDTHPVNKALASVAATQKRPASPMGSAILKGQFLD